MRDGDPDETSEAAPALSADIQNHIGQRLRALYDGIVCAPVPDRFHRLLAELDAAEAARQSAPSAPDAPASDTNRRSVDTDTTR